MMNIYIVNLIYMQDGRYFTIPRLFESVKDAREYMKKNENNSHVNFIAVCGPNVRAVCKKRNKFRKSKKRNVKKWWQKWI